MAAAAQRPELVAIVGPTASGKSDLAMKLAREFGGEIICADSRTIYKDMDIGTAKPTAAERKAVAHWGLDLVNPGKSFSAGKFKQYADAKILDIQRRGKLPILVGGTGLYVDGVLFDFSFIASKKQRWVYSWRSVDSLQRIIRKRGWPLPENSLNRRHLLRTIERGGEVGSHKNGLPENVLLIGLLPADEQLRKRIAKRGDKMFGRGIIQETEGLVDKYGRKAVMASGGIAYKAVLGLIRGDIAQEQAQDLIRTQEWQYARRQKTWFKRNAHIKWFTSPDVAYNAVKKAMLNT